MSDLIAIVFTAAIVNNFVLVYYLGLCPFMGTSNNTAHIRAMSLSIGVVLILSTLLTTVLRLWLLPDPELQFLFPLLAIVIVALSVQMIELVMRAKAPLMYASLGIFLPLVTTNCAILGVILLNRNRQFDLIESLAMALGASLGFALVLYIFSHMREKIQANPIPKIVQGAPIAFISAGILAMAFSGLAGLGS